MVMDNEMLINLVEGYEELYNPGHRQYNNQLRRDTIWKEIGETMNESGKTCKERWYKIRDNHRKALQLRKTKSVQSGITMKPPKYYKELQFLLPYIHDEESIDIDPQILTEQSMASLSPFIPSGDESLHCESPEPESWSVKTHVKRFKRNPEDSSRAKRKYSDIIEGTNTASSQNEHDPLIGFFINMGRTVKGFPLQEQIKIKSKVFSIVNNMEMMLAMQSNASEDQVSRGIK